MNTNVSKKLVKEHCQSFSKTKKAMEIANLLEDFSEKEKEQEIIEILEIAAKILLPKLHVKLSTETINPWSSK